LKFFDKITGVAVFFHQLINFLLASGYLPGLAASATAVD
jgi:hypothetical protein